jgi:two-component system sensor histidine kinase UhpB
VAISVHQTGQGVLLQVRDNGRGFEVAGTKGGIGLENIRRRAQMLNGKAEIISSPGNGCVLKVWLPQRAV